MNGIGKHWDLGFFFLFLLFALFKDSLEMNVLELNLHTKAACCYFERRETWTPSFIDDSIYAMDKDFVR